MSRFFMSLDYVCPSCGSEKTRTKDGVLCTQLAGSKRHLIDVQQCHVWLLCCYSCKMVFAREKDLASDTLRRIQAGELRIFAGANRPVTLLAEGTPLPVKRGGTLVSIVGNDGECAEFEIPLTVPA